MFARSRLAPLTPFLALVTALAGCGSSEQASDSSRGAGGGGAFAGGSGTDASGVIDTGAGGSGGFGGGADEDAAPLPDGACAYSEVAATRLPVDLMFLVDTSGSTFAYTDQTQKNINGLPTALAASGFDYRVAMVASPQNAVSIPFVPNVCVPPPLGGAACASNPPYYRSIVRKVDNHDALDAIFATYADPVLHWNDFFRKDAFKAFIIISDDYPGASANDASIPTTFDAQLLALDPAMFGTATARKYAVFPIAESLATNPGTKCNPLDIAGNAAPQYVALAQLTGGAYYEICQPDYGPIFQAIAAHLSSQLACTIDVPAPASGESLDYGAINVALTPNGGATQVIPQDASKPCDGGADGWQYSAGMKQINLCGPTCASVKAALDAKLTVQLGCATEVR